jgi:hypothetical protein
MKPGGEYRFGELPIGAVFEYATYYYIKIGDYSYRTKDNPKVYEGSSSLLGGLLCIYRHMDFITVIKEGAKHAAGR